MPKKSKWGSNPKAVEAKERKAAKKTEEEERRQKKIEDALWRDDFKPLKKKEERKNEKEKRKQDITLRKAENKARLMAEEEDLGGKIGKQTQVTQAQIQADRHREMEQLKEQAKRLEMKSKKLSQVDELLDENPNHLLRVKANEGELSARNVEDATLLLGGSLESKWKMTYSEFEAREMPSLKAENPGMKHSQLKQMVWKEWQRSPENPVNAPLKVRTAL